MLWVKVGRNAPQVLQVWYSVQLYALRPKYPSDCSSEFMVLDCRSLGSRLFQWPADVAPATRNGTVGYGGRYCLFTKHGCLVSARFPKVLRMMHSLHSTILHTTAQCYESQVCFSCRPQLEGFVE